MFDDSLRSYPGRRADIFPATEQEELEDSTASEIANAGLLETNPTVLPSRENLLHACHATMSRHNEVEAVHLLHGQGVRPPVYPAEELLHV